MKRCAALLLLAVACSPESDTVRTRLSLAEAMATGDTAGYLRAIESRPFRFPDDHGPHPGFRIEWWYLTGNLDGAGGERFGFQLTFFRSAQTPAPEPRASGWAASDIWMAHFALTDGGRERFAAFERLARGAADLAGARAAPFRVWLEDWSIASTDAQRTFPLRVRARSGDTSIDLVLGPGKPIVLQGDSGLSPKGPEPGNASFYYSLTRMPAQGTVESDGQTFSVTGLAWLDREWSTSALGAGVVGWDWFALQLEDGRDLMLYRLRRDDGSADPFSGGTIVSETGSTRKLAAADFDLTPLASWSSPIDGSRYPVRWQVSVPSERLDLTVSAILPDQELDVTVRYWEGAVDAAGTSGTSPIRGRGYLEMTGYATGSLQRSRTPTAASR